MISSTAGPSLSSKSAATGHTGGGFTLGIGVGSGAAVTMTNTGVVIQFGERAMFTNARTKKIVARLFIGLACVLMLSAGYLESYFVNSFPRAPQASVGRTVPHHVHEAVVYLTEWENSAFRWLFYGAMTCAVCSGLLLKQQHDLGINPAISILKQKVCLDDLASRPEAGPLGFPRCRTAEVVLKGPMTERAG